ncbi:MAG: hypothetical protein ABJ239_05330 [Erythrobacter sp.]
MRTYAVLSLAVLLSACEHSSPDQSDFNQTAAVEPPAFAEALCAGCHSIKPLVLSPNPQAPSFADIVNRPGVTRGNLYRFLSDAHNYPEAMDFDLEEGHVEELTNYMITLKDPYYRRVP